VADIDYSIVVPCYSSGDWLAELVSRIQAVMEGNGSFEIILVNDRSPDGKTWEAIMELAAKHESVMGIDLLYNVGQFKATLCGLDHARGNFIMTMDDDLQHPPEELTKLISAMHENPGVDCVMGVYSTKHHSAVRNMGSRLVKSIMNRLYDKPVGVTTTSFRIMPADFAKTLVLYQIAHPQLGPLILSITKNIANVEVEHHDRKHGASGYGFIHLVRETLHSVINASILPLRWFSLLGFFTAGAAFLIAIFYFFRWAMGGAGVAGFTSLILAISFFSGMLLAGIGVLGEYIGRLIQEVTGMPRYTVAAKVGDTDDEAC